MALNMPIEMGEIAAPILMFIACVLMLKTVTLQKERSRRDWWLQLFFGLCIILVSNTSTVAEGFYAPIFFNTLEHLCYGVGGVIFALACHQSYKQIHGMVGEKR